MELTDEQVKEIVNLVKKELTNTTEERTSKRVLIHHTSPAKAYNFPIYRGDHELEIEKEIDEENTDQTTETITSNSQNTFLSPELKQVLEKLSQETNQTTEEILRKAIALIKIAIYSEKEGANLAIIKDGEIMTEMTGFSTSAE